MSLEIPGGGWSVSGTLTASSTDILGVIGQAVITTNGTAIDATTLTELGTAPWSLPVPLAADGDAVSLLAFEPEDAKVAGRVRADLEAVGKPIGAYDLLIAGQALRHRHRRLPTSVGNPGSFGG